ncbi:MAG: hypothetical protein ACFFB5_20890 [Promethearchaeota archaeon]
MSFKNLGKILKTIIEDKSGFFKEISAIPFVIMGLIALGVTFMAIGDMDPARTQNLLLLIFGSFGAYLFLMRTYFDDPKERNEKQRTHIGFILVLIFLYSFPSLLISILITSLGGELDFQNTYEAFVSLADLYFLLCGLIIILFLIYLAIIDQLKKWVKIGEEEVG